MVVVLCDPEQLTFSISAEKSGQVMFCSALHWCVGVVTQKLYSRDAAQVSMRCRWSVYQGSTLRLKCPKYYLNPDLLVLIKVKIASDSCTVSAMWRALCGSTYRLFSELTGAKPHYELWVRVSAHIAFYCWLPCTDVNVICTLQY